MASKNSPTGSKKTAVIFLDRDGVINENPGDGLYVTRVEDFRLLPGTAEALIKLHKAGLKICVISNQAGVAKGLYTREELAGMDRILHEAAPGAIDGIYYCPHRSDDRCSCRKPLTGLIDQALSDLTRRGISPALERSYFIGDTIRDIATGKAKQLHTILVLSGKERAENSANWDPVPDETAADLTEAAARILHAL